MVLGEAEAHVWRASLCSADPECGRAWEILSQDERARAERFHFERDKRRFVLCRAALRTLLAEYAGMAAEDVSLQYGPYGKPCLPASYGLEFNVSHSLDVAVFALARHAVGVDIEAIRPVRHALRVAESFFAPSELAELQLAAPEDLDAAFLRCWTRKEAYVKGFGDGLTMPLESFAVGLDGDPGLGSWRFFNIDSGPGFMAALAVDCADATVVQRTL